MVVGSRVIDPEAKDVGGVAVDEHTEHDFRGKGRPTGRHMADVKSAAIELGNRYSRKAGYMGR